MAIEKQIENLTQKIEKQDLLIKSFLSSRLFGFWEWDVLSNVFSPSTELLNMLGIEKKEEVDTTEKWQTIIHENDRKLVTSYLTTLITNNNNYPIHGAIRYMHRDGSTVHLFTTALIEKRSTDGKVKTIIGAHFNISEQVKVKESLQTMVKKYNLTIEGIEAGIWSWEVLTNTVWWSDKFYAVLGYKTSEIEASQENFNAFLHPEDVPIIERGIQKHLEKQEVYSEEIRMRLKDGSYEWFNLSGKADINDGHQLVSMAGSLININKRKSAEIALKQNEYLLSEASKIAQMGIWEIDFDSAQLNWSKEVYHIHELPLTFKPNIDEGLNYYPEPGRSIIAHSLDNTRINQENFEEELPFTTAKNNTIWVKVKGYAVTNQLGETTGLRGVIQNIDHLKTREIKLENANIELNNRNNLLENFNHIISHNLKSHSGNIMMLLELFQNEKDEHIKKEILANLNDVGSSLEQTVNHLNQVLHIKSQNHDSSSYLLAKSIQYAINSLKNDIEKTQASIICDFPDNFEINGIEAYLDSICLNLISNAIKYKQPNSAPKIVISAIHKNNSTQVSFTDNGLGMDLKRVNGKIFGMYKTFHKNSNAEGVGLFMVKNQMNAMHGIIEVESQPNVGSKFTLSFNM